ncbi:MAG TPA: DUF6159 family protein [Capillimicrobium sp.]|nr:DUF6159 family protein [Capillimicrobium sp.]
MQGRIGRGWRLAKDSWNVLRSDRSLALFPIVGFLAGAAGLLLILAPGVGVAAAVDGWWPLVPFGLVALYAATFATIYAGVGLAAASAKVMDGGDATLADGLRAARERRGLIARWALVQTTVGVLLNALQALANEGNALTKLIGTILISLIGIAWNVASFFVIPLLAFEGLGPKDALRRSTSIIRERWGEGVVGSGSIGGIVFLVGMLPAGLVIAAGVVLGGPAGIALATVGAAALLAAMVVGNALSSIFRVALYRYATTEQTWAGFAAPDLAAAFAPKRRGRR